MAIVVEPFNPSTSNTPSNHMLPAPLLHEGVRSVEAGDCLVTANGVNLTLTVAAGEIVVKNDAYSVGGGNNEFWRISSSASENVTLDAADGSNPRYDVICAKVDDAASESVRGVSAGSFVAVKGTAAASPTIPSIPDDHAVLSVVTVGAGVSSISNGDLEDRRVDAYPIIENGGWITQQELSPVYNSSVIIRISNQDVRYKFPKGAFVRWKQGGSYKYGIVKSTAFATHTDITLASWTAYTVANSAITHFAVSYSPSPYGAPFLGDFRARAYRNASLTISTGSYQKINLDAESYDPAGNFDSTTNYRYTAPISGNYFVSGVVGVNANDGARIIVAIYKNGAAAQIGSSTLGSANTDFPNVVTRLELAAGDTIELYALVSAGSGGVSNVEANTNLTVAFESI